MGQEFVGHVLGVMLLSIVNVVVRGISHATSSDRIDTVAVASAYSEIRVDIPRYARPTRT